MMFKRLSSLNAFLTYDIFNLCYPGRKPIVSQERSVLICVGMLHLFSFLQ